MKRHFWFKEKLAKESGQVLLLTIISLGVVLASTLALVGGSTVYYENSAHSLESEKAIALAEAGLDKAVASLNKTGGSYNGETETPFGDGSFSVSITNVDASTKKVQATGYLPNKANPKIKRTVQIQVSKGVGISFIYGMLVGEGGITMGNGSKINGSVYANGNITGGNNEIISGDVYVAGGTQPSADQQTDCTSVCDPNGLIIGRNVSGNNQMDGAQSFKPATTAVLNKVALKLKKVGTPQSPTIRIMGDLGGAPDKNNVLASGILADNLVTNEYGFVYVTFSTTPTLTAGTTYWIMLAAASLDNSNYWYWQNDLAASYNGGSAEWSTNWQASHPVWSSANGDLSFATYMGGVATSISMNNGSIVQGNVHANTINGITINKDAYYQVINNSTVKGLSYPNSADPPPIPMPISQANINQWESDAASKGTISNTDVTGCPSTLGPGKINANVITANNCTITVTTPLWITGNLTYGNSTIFQMDPKLGSSSGVIIVDGTTLFQNSDNLLGTGTAGSFLTLLSTYNSQTQGGVAINTGNSSITGILYAPFGTITLANNANFKEAVAWQINMGTGTTLTYDSGLISTFFSTGPGGSFSTIKGTYQVK